MEELKNYITTPATQETQSTAAHVAALMRGASSTVRGAAHTVLPVFLALVITFQLVLAASGTAPITTAYADELSDTRAEIADVKEEIETLQEQIAEYSEEYNTAQLTYDETVAEIEEIQSTIDDLQDKIGTRSIQIYKDGGISSYIAAIFGASTLNEVLEGITLLTKLNEEDAANRNELATQQEALETKKTELEETIAEIQAITDEVEAQQDELQDKLDNLEEEELELLAAAGTVSTGSSVSAPSNTYGSAILAAAYTYYGKGYSYGGSGPNYFDCSGFVQAVYADVGISLPHQSEAIKNSGTQISVSSAEPGDVLWRRGHVAICISVNGNTVTYCDSQNYGTVIQTRTSSVSAWSCAVRF